MALAKVFRKATDVMLIAKVQRILPSTTLKTSAPVQWFFDNRYKPEYDEQGELGFPEEDDLATGIAKAEIEARKAGDNDPYTVGAISRGDKGSKLDPILVPSAFESRTIGCKCVDDQSLVLGMWLHQGEPKRCRCGFWFLLYYKEPFCDWTIPQ